MVKIKILMEGGAHPNSKPDANTITNSAFLRESMSRLINSAFPTEKVKIECETCGSYSSAISQFTKSAVDDLLLIDLEGPESTRTAKLLSHGLDSVTDKVFFMVQKMESWILSQPEQLQKGLITEGYIKESSIDLALDPNIIGIHTQDFEKPDAILNSLLMSHFKELKGDSYKPFKYRKLKNSYILIGFLDIIELCRYFKDAANLINIIQNKI